MKPAALALAVLAAVTGAAGARQMQSALQPFGPAATDIAQLWWILLVGAVVIFIGVMTLVLLPLLRPRRRDTTQEDAHAHREATRDPRNRWFIVGGGLVFPAIVLIPLLVYAVSIGARLTEPAQRPLAIELTGYMWWWEVRYGEGDEALLVSANELRIPVGRPVQLSLRSGDVIHSFWVPNLAGKTDLIPGRTTRLSIAADTPGTYRSQCAEFCGMQHAQMALHVVAQEASEWDAWFAAARRRQLGAASDDALLTDNQRHGRDVFVRVGCGACHSLRGVSEAPRGLAPDLTHIGSRPSLAAGMLPNNPGTLGAWIVGAQELKRGSRMPSFHALAGRDLTALTDYLGSLR